jgi:hypothetical protein
VNVPVHIEIPLTKTISRTSTEFLTEEMNAEVACSLANQLCTGSCARQRLEESVCLGKSECGHEI